jgi:ADP-ribosylglycohydrolase
LQAITGAAMADAIGNSVAAASAAKVDVRMGPPIEIICCGFF